MINPSLIKTAADHIEAQAARIAALESELAGTRAQVAKVAADAAATVAAAKPSADLVGIAKAASDKLLEQRFLSSPANRDAFAAKIASDHAFAIEQLAKLGASATPAAGALKKVGSPVAADATPGAANDTWVNEYAQYKASQRNG